MGWAWSFTRNFTFIFVHIPRPAENTAGMFCLSSGFNFSVLEIGFSNLRQNVLIEQSQRLDFSIQSLPNGMSVFFSTYTMSFFVIPFKVTVRTTSPKMFILSSVTEHAVFFVLNKAGLFRRRHVCKFIIERSEPDSSWNFTVSLKFFTVTYLRKFPSLLSPGCVCLYFWVFWIFWHTNNVSLRVQIYPSFYWLTSFLLDKTSSSVGHHILTWPFIRTLFVVNFWSHNFKFFFLWGIACSFALVSWNMSNSRFLNSFRVTFNG